MMSEYAVWIVVLSVLLTFLFKQTSFRQSVQRYPTANQLLHQKELPKILYGSQRGTCRRLALELQKTLDERGYHAECMSLKDYEVEDLFKEKFVTVLISTYENGSPPDDAKWFCRSADSILHRLWFAE